MADGWNTPSGNAYAQFVNELRRLHLYAGQQGPRDLARRASKELRVSITPGTIERALRGPRLPRWNVTLVLVKLLHGDERYFQQLWLAAKAHITGTVVAAPRSGRSPTANPRSRRARPNAPRRPAPSRPVLRRPMPSQHAPSQHPGRPPTSSGRPSTRRAPSSGRSRGGR
jgi:hypothetical protein